MMSDKLEIQMLRKKIEEYEKVFIKMKKLIKEAKEEIK